MPTRASPDPFHAEHWRQAADSDSVAVLRIPGPNRRGWVFDIDATLLVQVAGEAQGAWPELTVEFDGLRQWSSRIPARNPGPTDGLECHQRLQLAAEQGVRVCAVATVRGCKSGSCWWKRGTMREPCPGQPTR